jgi:amino acid adenylation domain-containing protein
MKKIEELIALLRKNNIQIFLQDGNLRLVYDDGQLTDDLLLQLRQQKSELIAFLESVGNREEHVSIPLLASAAYYPLSSSQKRLWILSQFVEASVAYNMPFSMELDGDYRLEYFEQTISALIERHEILRTTFKLHEDGEVYQYVTPHSAFEFKIRDYDFMGDATAYQKATAIIQEDSYEPFDLESGPLFRFFFFRVDDARCIIYYNLHHIISDGWSMGVLSRDVIALYTHFAQQTPLSLPELKIQYKDYASWQQQQTGTTSYDADKKYWKETLSGELPVLDLSGKPRPSVKRYEGRVLGLYFTPSQTEALKNYCHSKGGSLFMGLVSLWKVLLYRYTGSEDLILGTPVAGRNHTDLEDQIGFYVNTLALRTVLHGNMSFDQVFEAVKENTLAAFEHQSYPFDAIVDDLNLVRDTSRSPVFDLMIVLQNAIDFNTEKGTAPVSEIADMSKIHDFGSAASKFDLEFMFSEVGNALSFSVQFNEALFEVDAVERMMAHFRNMVDACMSQPLAMVDSIDFLEEAEKTLLKSLNGNESTASNGKTIIDLFNEQVSKTPENTALVFGPKTLTYTGLDQLSDRLAAYLLKVKGLSYQDFVGIKLVRSEWVVVSLLAVMKAGGTYVPIDLDYPAERIAYIENDCNCTIMIDQQFLETFFTSTFLEMELTTVNSLLINLNSNGIAENDLAYVIYTSGTTGNPKGVMIEHASLTNYIMSGSQEYLIEGETVDFGLYTSLSFDLTVTSLFLPLINGGTLTVFPSDEEITTTLKAYLEGGISCIKITPAHIDVMKQLDVQKSSLRLAIVGGDALLATQVETLQALNSSIRIFNEYGPTESTVGSTTYAIESIQSPILIGKPIANTEVYLFDSKLNLVPIGVKGELYIGGSGLARGYKNAPDLTRQKFIPHPFKDNARLYKTGDVVQLHQDGNLAYHGRIDDQVKIRGYRIELGEIQRAITLHTAILECAVIVVETSGEKELAAYFVSEKVINPTELRNFLAASLPAYMIPSHLIQLEAIPLTSNGKIDKKGLSSINSDRTDVDFLPANTDLERKLVSIWEDITGRSPIGMNDNFFELGGNSLKAIKLQSAYQKAFGIKVSLKAFFQRSSLSSHVLILETEKRARELGIEPAPKQESYPLSDAQKRLWVLSQFESASVAYNMPDWVELNGSYVLEILKRALDATIDRHEILRTTFKTDDLGNVKQYINDRSEINYRINEFDFRNRQEEVKYSDIRNYIETDSFVEFDLENGPLLRVALFRTTDAQIVLYYNMHHIIGDAWSMEILKKDLMTFYGAFLNDKLPELPPLQIQYKDFAVWKVDQSAEEKSRNYWQETLRNRGSLLNLPGQKPRPAIQTYNGRSLATNIGITDTQKLRAFCVDQHGSLFMGILATWAVTFNKLTKEEQFVLGTSFAGRNLPELENQIGFYVNTIPLNTSVADQESFGALFSRFKNDVLEAYEYQSYPFDEIVKELKIEKDLSRNPLFDVMIVLPDMVDPKVDDSENIDTETIEDKGEMPAKLDILITFLDKRNHLHFDIKYNTDVYAKATIERLIKTFKKLISELMSDPEKVIAQIELEEESADNLRFKNSRKFKLTN